MYGDRGGPMGFFDRLLDFAILIAVVGCLIRLGISCIVEVRWALLVILVVVIAAVIAWRIWKNRHPRW